MKNIFGIINQRRGMGYKLQAYAMFAALFFFPLLAIHPNYPLWQWAAIIAAYLLHLMILFQWSWGSEYWPSLGKAGNERELHDLWAHKGMGAFLILGIALLDPITAVIGIAMAGVARIYFEELTPEMPDSISRVNYRMGKLYGFLICVPIIVALAKRIYGW